MEFRESLIMMIDTNAGFLSSLIRRSLPKSDLDGFRYEYAMQVLMKTIIAIILPLIIFALLAIEISKNSAILAWDTSILLAIHQTAQPPMDRFAAILTQLGIYWGVIPLTAVISLFLLYRKKWNQARYLITTMLGCAIISPTIKILLHRERPQLWQSSYPLPENYSFPSSHAMWSMTLVVALVILTWGSRWSWLLLLSGSLFVVAIAWTRLYLGVHFPSDIIAGWLLSLAWAVSTSFLLKVKKVQKDEFASRVEHKS
jgi:membrane-associated phospholipid phosphatase